MPPVKEILAAHRLAPSKRLGQNFLVHPHIAEQIVAAAAVGPEDTVIELGVGLGALTLPLARQAGRVIGLEIDAGLVRYHQETNDLPANVTLLHQDLLTADFVALSAEAGGKLKMVANLPYAVTNPLLFKLIEARHVMEWAVLMVQKEVALRLTARPGSKEYGVLSVLLGGCATVERVLTVGPGNFHPRPKVDSMVVRLDFRRPPLEVAPELFPKLRRLVDAAFRQRRKTLRNSLTGGHLPGLDQEKVGQLLAAAAINPKQRAEELTIADYLRMAALTQS